MELIISSLLMFFGCWYAHAHLYATRPEIGRLTGCYFVIALGGALGGFAAVVVLFAAAVWRGAHRNLEGTVLAQERNFYGTTTVIDTPIIGVGKAEADGKKPPTYVAIHNNGTMHGIQYAVGAWRRYTPSLYYSKVGGGMAILNHPAYLAGKPMRVALLGMGIGTMAYYGREGDTYRFFEIDPNVIKMATNPAYFTFLSNSSAKIEISEGDARKQLEAERGGHSPRYDLIVVDVFSGDSVPAHLATAEAVALYLNCLAPDGVIAMHITNWHINLLPVVKALARNAGLELRTISSVSDEDDTTSFWAYLSREPLALKLNPSAQREIDMDAVADCAVPTDDHHSLMSHIRLYPQTDFRYLPSSL